MSEVDSLPAKQKEALTQFMTAVKDVAHPRHQEFDFLRFLRARAFNLQKAEKMYRASMQWRKEWDADNFTKWETPEVIDKYYAGGYYGKDRDGCPVWYELTGLIDVKGLHYCAHRKDVIKGRMKLMESFYETLLPEASAKHGKPVHQCAMLYDMDGIGLKHLWKPAIDVYTEMLAMLEANYPETLKKCYIINTPSFFPIAYNLCKPFLSEDTKKKLYVLGKNWKTEIQKYIAPDELPAYWGGTATGPDGDPKCSHKLCFGGSIPESYRLSKPDVDLEKFTIQTVGRGSSLQVEALVDSPGMIITWQFWTEGQDIGFGVFRRTAEQRQKKGEMEEMIKSERVNSHVIPENGSLTCDAAGTYILRFDNTYSWVNSKKIFYTLDVLEPTTLEEIHAENFTTQL